MMNKLQIANKLVDAFVDGTLNKILKAEGLSDTMLDKLTEENEYQKFFAAKLKAAEKPIAKMSKEEKSAFFADIKKGWASQKKSVGEHIDSIINSL